MNPEQIITLASNKLFINPPMGSSNNAIEKDESDKCQIMQQRRRGRQRQQVSASAHISRDQIEELNKPEYLLIPVQKEERVPLTIDAF